MSSDAGEPAKRRGGRRAVPPPQRFWAKVDKNGPVSEYRPDLGQCWLWLGGISSDGYSRFREGAVGSKTVGGHRWSYIHLVGPIPPGLHLDHLCRVRHCVNPQHLEPVTCAVNLLRGESFSAVNAAKTHCPAGHPFSTENTYVHPTQGTRACLTCRRKQDRTAQARRRALVRKARGAA